MFQKPQCAEPSRGRRQVKKSQEISQNSSLFLNSETIDVDSEPITVVDLDPGLDGKYHRQRYYNFRLKLGGSFLICYFKLTNSTMVYKGAQMNKIQITFV